MDIWCTITRSVHYYPPRQSPFASTRKVRDLSAFQEHAKATHVGLPGFRFRDPHIYATPKGLVVRYLGAWQGADDSLCHLPAVALFRFVGEQVRQVGASWSNPQRFEALQKPAQTG